MPTLFAAAKPTLEAFWMTRTSFHHRAASLLPSVDWLSTTIVSCAVAGGAACRDARQRSRSTRALYETIMMDSIDTSASDQHRCDRFCPRQHYYFVRGAPPPRTCR